MWTDNEANRDSLNFKVVADTAAEMISRAEGKPISMGVSGGWGVGKSSMIKLIKESLLSKPDNKFVFVEFNAWLYQGYDDARAALIEVIARRLVAYAEEKQTAVDKAKELLSRINWFRTIKFTASVAPMVLGAPPTPDAVGTAAETAGGLLNEKKPETPPKQIHDLRDHFAAILKDLGIILVVLVDDLDRCLPSTAISTLEAMRHFLFMEQTAFVIAADDKMIRQSVRAHFKDINLDDDLVTSYFDKLVQVPIRVPPLGTQEVRAYLFLLFIEDSNLSETVREELRTKICKQLSETWQGKRVDRNFVLSLMSGWSETLKTQFDLADRLAPIMTRSNQIAGNPRLIKRFLNTLSIRMAAARTQGVTVDEAVLAKMLLFERCGHPQAYSKLVQEINDHHEGKPVFLKNWEQAAMRGEAISGLYSEWDNEFIKNWLALSPPFHDVDLRSAVYISREHMPIITAADQLSSEAGGLLSALMEVKSQTTTLIDPLRKIGKRDLSLIMERLLSRARQVQEWGTPPILFALLTVISADESQAESVNRFLSQIPCSQLRAPIVPLLKDKSWAAKLLQHWHSQSDTPGPVKKAIESKG